MTRQADYQADAAARRVWTVWVAGSGRHEGVNPSCYVIDADTMTEAKRRAWLAHQWIETSERGLVAADGTVPTWSHARNAAVGPAVPADDVVIDCPPFGCWEGAPFGCADPAHRDGSELASAMCRCGWFWRRLRWAEMQPVIDLDRLIALGYPIHQHPPPEENSW
ncbi:hypothetical protein GCM10027089_15200 [Nocardia thraciensis]